MVERVVGQCEKAGGFESREWAAVLAELGHSRLAASETDDPEALTPLYMRAAQVQMAQRKKKEAR